MTTRIYGMWLYFLSLFIFFSSVSPMVMWILMEFNLLTFIFLMSLQDSKDSGSSKDLMLYYFLIQSCGSFVYLFSLFLDETLFTLLSSFFFVLAMTLKVGIFPLFFWILKLGSSLSSLIFILILSLQKVPMFFIMFQTDFDYIMEFLLLSYITGMILIFFSSDVKGLLVASSISNTFWIYNFFYIDIWFFFFFNFIYFLSLLHLFKLSSGCEEVSFNSDFQFSLLLFIFLCGIPPLSLFFMKFFMIHWVTPFSSNFFFIFIWVLTFFSLTGYTKFFYSTFFSSNFLYLHNEFVFKKMSFLVFGGLMFSPLLLNYQGKLFKLLSSYLK